VRDTETTDEAPAPRDLTAVVVDWNLPDHTIRCVRALVADGLPPDHVVVVENGPTDENWAKVTTQLASSVLVRLASNVGFAAAVNAGASVLPAGAYLVVNNDAFVHRPGTIQTMLGVLHREAAGVVVPRLLNADLSLQPTVAPFTVPFVAFARASGLSRLVPNRWQPRVSTHWDHATSRRVQAAIGAVMLVDGDVWSQLGGLHESAFMYAEDLDLCWRAHRRGQTTWFVAEAEFIHLGGASSSERWSSHERAEQIGRAEAAMIQTHLGTVRATLALGVMRLGLAARVVWFSMLQNRDAAESCRGFLAGLRRPLAPPEAPPSTPAMEVVRPG